MRRNCLISQLLPPKSNSGNYREGHEVQAENEEISLIVDYIQENCNKTFKFEYVDVKKV